jgi:hypothetical protein
MDGEAELKDFLPHDHLPGDKTNNYKIGWDKQYFFRLAVSLSVTDAYGREKKILRHYLFCFTPFWHTCYRTTI